MNKEELIEMALSLSPSALPYYVSRNLALLFPEKTVIESDNALFDVEAFAQDQQCHLEPKADVHQEFLTNWEGPDEEFPEHESSLIKSAKNAWLEVTWHGHLLDVLKLEWFAGSSEYAHTWLLADDKEGAEAFFTDVCEWNAEVHGELLVFDDGCWQKDRHLFHAIQSATFDNLVLPGDLKQTLRDDLTSFFAARDLYQAYTIPWKRGILLVGPPGNGKTHAVKALINLLEKPCLYVKSFKAEYRTDERNMRDVFSKARRSAPCILVLEDLDSLLTAENRAFFLNELDGFAANIGIVTLATTNHPERLDPSILNRPSRFDRKYTFDLPGHSERVTYLLQWNASLQQIVQLSTEAVTSIATETQGFSFAYLKELVLSALMRWIASPQPDILDKLLLEQVGVLRQQMTSRAFLPDENAHQSS